MPLRAKNLKTKQYKVKTLDDSAQDPITPADILQEFFQEDTDSSKNPVTVDRASINFGSCSRFKLTEYRIVTVRNHTNSKMTCNWFMPKQEKSASGANEGENPFLVFPSACDILPQSSAEFKISFRPGLDNAFYSCELECYAYFKVMRSFRLVDDKTFTPPKCICLRVTGNTFPPTSESFVPRALLTPSQNLIFPSCHIQERSYQTVILVCFFFNDGNINKINLLFFF